jgi:hypothetical protein
MTYVLPVEFQVRFTSLDTLGGERMVTLPETDLGEAIEACDHIRVNQETYQLPVDACIWCRTAQGSWQRWAGENR